MKKIIGRDEEKRILEAAYKSDQPELIALFGRRRVGKTYLVRNLFKERNGTVFFNVTGMKEGKMRQQIKNFAKHIANSFYRPGARIEIPANWYDALDLLADEIKASSQKKIVLFFDEFPWMATRRSELLTAFEYFWNNYGSTDSRITAIICGSSAGWIVNKIVNNRGALYNRVTRRICLESFNLHETERYLAYKKVRLNKKQITHLYMVLGGIPFYLSHSEPGLSAVQIVAELAFKKNSFLLNEFENLYATLFDDGGGHIDIARIIAKHAYGIGFEELVREAKHLSSGGTLGKWLNDLEHAGFIQRFKPFGEQKKGFFYKMIDEYSLFYFHWIEPIKGTLREKGMQKTYWERLQNSPSWHTWAGYAFESLCHKHLFTIMNALNIGDTAIPYTWRYVPPKKSSDRGAQIDLLFDRDDDMISICEIKYTAEPFIIDKVYALTLARKMEVFEKNTKTRKQFLLYMISAHGVKKNFYSEEMLSGICTLTDLFKK